MNGGINPPPPTPPPPEGFGIPGSHDPRLKIAMKEIVEVMQKHDVAGFVVLQCPTHTEFGFYLEPSYSLVKMKGQEMFLDDPVVSLKALGVHPEEQKKRQIYGTLNMVVNLQLVGTKVVASLFQAQAAIRQRFQIKVPDKPKNGHDHNINPKKRDK